MLHLIRDRLKKNVLIGFPLLVSLAVPCRMSVLNASPIKEKKSPNVLRHKSVHMLHLSSNVLKKYTSYVLSQRYHAAR
jgi:hypothetical protein